MLEVGTKAPEFTLPDQNGKLHSLSDYLGQRLFYIFIRRTVRPAAPNRPAALVS